MHTIHKGIHPRGGLIPSSVTSSGRVQKGLNSSCIGTFPSYLGRVLNTSVQMVCDVSGDYPVTLLNPRPDPHLHYTITIISLDLSRRGPERVSDRYTLRV